MKIQRTHRRKLRFASAKDVAPVVTVMVERAPERPLKRRKRQPRPRRVSPAPTRLESGLPAATWSNIQEHFAAAKSLGEMYVFKRLPYEEITADFFSEHEHLQGCSSGPVFPIFVPSSEIYKMKGRTCMLTGWWVSVLIDRYIVPRKRRIYDVLHVLEGIGVIKRVRYDERRRTNGGYFLYYGKAAVVQHLAEMKSNSAQVMVDFRKSRRSKRTSTVEEDSALVRVFEDQAAAGKWPCLVTMTVCFLGLLFQQDYQTEVGLPTLSARLGEAKKFIGTLLPSSSTEAPYRDVHRRVYDVVSVLVSCNMIATSPVPSSVPMEKGLRKYVRFNYDIFTDPRILFATPDSVEQWNDDTSSESMVPMEKNDWCDESLKQLGLYDALPAEDKIDWELNKKLQENYREMWGCLYPGAASAYALVEAQPHQCWVGKVEMTSGDLECHERLDEDDMVGNTANFFC
ncbi:hypothetical protein JG688_00000167 [Phytophthora aleatoria]|uniref:E2F/DP family winged-helix DNA-binding domain-containing protein n=1 Tax=Phytophthora aleatoria TaxID=2496075 RepID=A0A8J5MIP8_9STRA|nr:hypothetical protein JG688_00000167 [Phytophthora aleatoria]